ncbi:MAG: IS21 family transposase [Candidatus Brocadiaceae bacterium]|nr:IS21 family transposase [Candidatus Brocadiaceae bacterium]
MAKMKRMDQVRMIIKNYESTQSIKATARQLNLSKNTVRDYLRRCKKHNDDVSSLLELDDDQLRLIIYPVKSKETKDRQEIFSDLTDYLIKELRRVGVTRHLLWEEYRLKHPQGYGYSQFCERLKKEIGRKELTINLKHRAGEVMMVDFAGKKLGWVDVHTGELYTCEVLVAVFPHSQYTFVIALPSQQIGDFVYGLNQALLFFRGVPNVILSDNLKSYVTRADKYEPKFTQLCEQLGAHFQVDLQAARVAKPKDKASVESGVGIAYWRIYGPLRNEIFHSPQALNEAIGKQLDLHNTKPYQKKEGSRQEIFQTYELPILKDLPDQLFEIKKIASAKVQRNYHVFLGEEKNYYSVSYQYVGHQAQVIYTSQVVEIFIKDQRVAIHKRLFNRGNYHYQTNEKHMPERHRKWKEIKGYDAQYFLNEAQKIGSATHWAMQHVLLSKIHEAQTYNSCKGILHLAKKYTADRLEKAAGRCQKLDKVSYGMLKRILKLKLDQAEEAPELLSLPFHDNIRGPKNYR